MRGRGYCRLRTIDALVSGGGDPHVLGPGCAPTPFTADEIRRGSPVGKVIRLRVEPEGQEPFERVNRYLEADADGAVIERRHYAAGGEPKGVAEVWRTTWLELQEHASFPSESTTIRAETIETPLGALACLRYTVVDGQTVQTLWFATTMPGMPIKTTREEAGRVTSVVTMLESRTPR
jgi:hypothetical protein